MAESEDSERRTPVDGMDEADGAPRELGEKSAEEELQRGQEQVAAVPCALVVDPPNSIFARILKMKEQQAELKKKRKEGQKELRNLERKRKRLSDRAKLLSDEDLLQVLSLRRETKALSKASSSSGGADAPKPSATKS